MTFTELVKQTEKRRSLSNALPIVDNFGRAHSNLRISVTDRCNIRCVYCMPEFVKFLPQRDVLSFEEITRLVKTVAPLGVSKLRLTGGEPLVRKQLPVLVEMLKSIAGVEEVAMTTNAVLLAGHATSLKQAGLDRLNISLDTVDRDRFKKITRRDVLPQVLEGIAAAQQAGFKKIRINAVPLPSLGDEALLNLARFCLQQNLELRFIEFMPLDGDQAWEQAKVRQGSELRQLISENIGTIEPAARVDPSQPAVDYRYRDSGVGIGFIDSVSKPFCATCNRMRITAEGKFRNCLFSDAEWDLKEVLRHGSSEDVESVIREAILAKKRGHGSDDYDFARPSKAMYQIGG